MQAYKFPGVYYEFEVKKAFIQKKSFFEIKNKLISELLTEHLLESELITSTRIFSFDIRKLLISNSSKYNCDTEVLVWILICFILQGYWKFSAIICLVEVILQSTNILNAHESTLKSSLFEYKFLKNWKYLFKKSSTLDI
ncbi:hypothetical protein BpHYR1_039213 [Brachionus plicatilis]|uniref:Uncharacterized protein n=1 Tax=Brachionus plicatilis TaxID=10195 RepID=A0A3M7QVR1_BRAPC|nr:hypothetical protein BpHYR1_039213 [Brachionus plicatilis]